MRWFLGALAALACSGERAAVPPVGAPSVALAKASAAAPLASAPGTGSAVVPFGELPPARDPRVERYFAESRRVSTPENMMGAHKQTPPPHWRGLKTPSKRPFPGVPYSEVRAFTVGNDSVPSRNHAEALLLDRKVRGCGFRAIAKDGTLCPSLNPPGVVLTAEQANRLVLVLEDAQPRAGRPRTISMCMAVPSLVFVFSDAGRPVAEMWMDGGCHYVGVHAAAAKWYPWQYVTSGADALGKLCAELALPSSGCELADPELRRAVAAQRETDGIYMAHVRARRVPLGVPFDLKQSQLNDAQKERLCIGQALENRRSGGGTECPAQSGGDRFLNLDADTCIKRFPSCDLSIGEIAACQRHAAIDVCLEAPEAAHCRPWVSCFYNRSYDLRPEP